MNSESRTKAEYYRGDQKQVLHKKRKPRLRWTRALHQHFVQAVNQLGGAYEATPKNIIKLMGVQEITSSHIKSHLQKYRHNICRISSIETAENVVLYEERPQHNYTINSSMAQIKELGSFQRQVMFSQERNPTAVLQRISETVKVQNKISQERKSEEDEPLTGCKTLLHSLSSCMNFSTATCKNQETYKVDAKAGSSIQLALNEIEKTQKLDTDDAKWLAAIKKDRLSSLRDEGAEEAEQNLQNVSIISIGLHDMDANSSSRFLEGRPKARTEYNDNFGEAIPVPNKCMLTMSTENRPLCGSSKRNFASNYQSFDLNVPMPEE